MPLAHWQPLRGDAKQLRGSFDSRGWFLAVGSLALFCVWWRITPPSLFLRAGVAEPADIEHLASYLCLLGLTGAIPLLVLQRRFQTRPGQLGLQLGDWRLGMRCVALALPIAVVILWAASFDPALRATYPLIDMSGAGFGAWVVWEIIALVYYTAWELYFRGVLLFGLRASLGAAGAMAFQVAASTLAHADKPIAELLAAIPAAVLFGVIALRTRSILYVVILHYAIGVLMDVSVVAFASGR